jgi:AraC family transcriptional regulator
MTSLKVSHGLANRTLSLGQWRLTHATYAPSQQVAKHEHALPSWTFVIAGSFQETFSREEFVCGAGSVLTKPATADHANRYGPIPTSCLLIEAVPKPELNLEILDDLFSAPRLFTGGVVPRVLHRIHQAWSDSDRIAAFSLECLLLELQLASARSFRGSAKPIGKRWLNEVRDDLVAKFRSPPSLSELARVHNLHPAYMCQEFKSVFGLTMGEFVRDLRFEWARDAVASGVGSLTDIALAAGFSDQSHLSRDFQRRLGASPRRFREAVRRR